VKSEAAKHGQSPVEYMLAVMRDESASLDRRDRMAAAAAPYVCPRLAVVDVNAKVKTEDTALLNDEERRQRARQMILEAFAERPAIPDLRVVAGREMSQSVGESMGGGKVIDAIPLEKHEKEPSEGG
jgi:hypothetical protein